MAVDAVGLAPAGDVGQPQPVAVGDDDRVAAVAVHPQLVQRYRGPQTAGAERGGTVVEDVAGGHVDEVDRGQRQRVGRGVTAQVDLLDALDPARTPGRARAGIGDVAQVQRSPTAQPQRVHTRAADDAGELAAGSGHGPELGHVVGVQHEDIVAGAADHHVGATSAGDDVGARAGHEGFRRRGARLRVGARAADEIDRGRQALAPEDDKAAAGVGATGRVGAAGTEDQVGEAVAVDVASRGDRGAQFVTGALAIDHEAAATGGNVRKLDRRRAGAAEDDVAATGVCTRRGVEGRADDQVGQTVAVDVAGQGHRDTGAVTAAFAVDDKTTASGGHGCEVDRGRARATEHQVGAPRVAAAGRVGLPGTDDEVGQPVAVDVPDRGDCVAAGVTGALGDDHETAAARSHRRQLDRGVVGTAEHHVAAAALGAGRGVAAVRADDQVGDAVGVDVAGGRDIKAALVERGLAVDDEAALPACHGREVDARPRAAAEDHIAAAGIGTACRVGTEGADDQVGQAVAVEVAHGRDTAAAAVGTALTIDAEAAAAARHGAELDGGGRRAAEDDIAATRVHACGRVAEPGADDQVGQAVTVDVACGGHGDTAGVAGTLAVDDEAARATGHGGQVDDAGRRAAEDDIAAAGAIPGRGIGCRRAHDQVVQAVAVDISGRGDRVAALVAGALAIDHKAPGARDQVSDLQRQHQRRDGGVDVGVDDQLRGGRAVLVDAVDLPARGDVVNPHPAAVGDGKGVTGIAVDPHLAPPHRGTEAGAGNGGVVEHVHARRLEHVARGQREAVVAAAGEVDLLEAVDAAGDTRSTGTNVGDGGQVQRDACAAQAQRVRAAAAGHLRETPARGTGRKRRDVAGIQDEDVIPGSAEHHVCAPVAGDHVVAGPGHEGLGRSGAGQGVGASTADETEGAAELRAAEDDVAASGVAAGGGIGLRRADDQVGKTVIVEIARSRHRTAAAVARALPVDDEAAGSGCHGRQVHRCGASAAKDNIAAAGVGACRRVGARRADDQIGQTVAVDVPRSGHAAAAAVTCALAVDGEAALASRHRGQGQRRSRRPPQNDEGAPGVGASSRVGTRSADGQVGEAVTVDVAEGSHRQTAGVAAGLPFDGEATAAASHRRQVDPCRVGAAEHDIAAAGVSAAGRISLAHTDDQVGHAVAVDVAGSRHGQAAAGAGGLTFDGEAARAGRHRAELDSPRGAAAVDDVGPAGVAACARVSQWRRDDEVRQTVAVEIARPGHGAAAAVACAGALDHEAARTRRDCRQRYRGRGAAAEDNVGAACVTSRRRVGAGRADDQIRQAVAVDVTRRSHGGTAAVACGLTVDDEATTAAGHRRQVDRSDTAAASEDDVAAAGLEACRRVGIARADDEIADAVAVDVARARHRPAAAIARSLAVDRDAVLAGGDVAEVDACRVDRQRAAAAGGIACAVHAGQGHRIGAGVAECERAAHGRGASGVQPPSAHAVGRDAVGGAGHRDRDDVTGAGRAAEDGGGVVRAAAVEGGHDCGAVHRHADGVGQRAVASGVADDGPELVAAIGQRALRAGRRAPGRAVGGALQNDLAAGLLATEAEREVVVGTGAIGRAGVDEAGQRQRAGQRRRRVHEIAGVGRQSCVRDRGVDAGRVAQRAAIEQQGIGRDGDAIGVRLARLDGVAEGEHRRAGAAGIGGQHDGAADLEPERGCRAGGEDRLVEGHGGSDGVARIERAVLRAGGACERDAGQRGGGGVHRDAEFGAARADVARRVDPGVAELVRARRERDVWRQDTPRVAGADLRAVDVQHGAHGVRRCSADVEAWCRVVGACRRGPGVEHRPHVVQVGRRRHGRARRRDGVDTEAGVVSHRGVGERRVGTGRVAQRTAVGGQRVQRNRDAVRVVLTALDGVLEGQRRRARAAGVPGLHRYAADVQDDHGRATGHVDGDRLVEGDSDAHHVPGIQRGVLDARGSAELHRKHAGRVRAHRQRVGRAGGACIARLVGDDGTQLVGRAVGQRGRRDRHEAGADVARRQRDGAAQRIGAVEQLHRIAGCCTGVEQADAHQRLGVIARAAAGH